MQEAAERSAKSMLKLQESFNKAKRYSDFRKMLEQKDIDAVLVATPDHTHAVVGKAAMELGKHVYVEKPLTWSVHEARVLRETAARTKVITQMGNMGHSSEGAALVNEWVQAGVIGPVTEVHVWTNRPLGYWPQGIPRPGKVAPAATAQTNVPGGGTTGGGAAAQGGSNFGTDWSARTVNRVLASRWTAIFQSRAGLIGTFSLVRGQTCRTTRSTIRSTGVAGQTGALAQ